MKALLIFLRFIIVSPEFLVCAVGLGVYVLFPSPLILIGRRIGDQAELLKYFGLLPAGLIVYDSNLVKSILVPSADTRNRFQKWELYSEFKMGCIIGLLYAVLFAICGVICLFFDWKEPEAYQAALLFTSIVGAVVIAASFYLHSIKMEEVFRRFSKPVQ